MFKRLFGGKKEPKSPAEQAQEIQRLLIAGETLKAVKLYRELSGLSLAEAKEHIEAMAAELAAQTPMGTPAATVTPEAIVTALENRRKIEAVKLYREATGQGLKKSKDAVDAAEQALQYGRDHALTSINESLASAPATPPKTLSEADMQQIIDEILDGRKINAIKLYRQKTSLRLKEAKEAVEALERQLK